MLVGAIYAAFLLQRGVSLPQLALLQIVYSSTVLLAQLPTGFLADKKSPKLATVIACLFIAPFYFLCLLAPDMRFLIVAEIIFSIGMSLMYGAIESWIVQTARLEYPGEKKMINYLGHLRKEITGLTCMVTGFLGALLASVFEYSFVFILTGVIILCLMFAFIGTRNKACASFEVGAYISKDLDSSLLTRLVDLFSAPLATVRLFLRDKNGLFYLLVSSFLVVVYQPVYHFWQPLSMQVFQEVLHTDLLQKYKEICLGVTFCCSNGMVYITNLVIRRYVIRHYNPFKIGAVVTIVATLLFTMIGTRLHSQFWHYLLAFSCLHGALSATATISEDQYLQVAPHKSLASLLSFAGIVHRLVSIIILTTIM